MSWEEWARREAESAHFYAGKVKSKLVLVSEGFGLDRLDRETLEILKQTKEILKECISIIDSIFERKTT